MLAKKVLGKPRFFRDGYDRLAWGREWMQTCAPLGGKILVHIAFLDEGHGNSDRSVACLNGARLKRSSECRRREGETLTITSSLRAFKLACWASAYS